jgi:tetratricopeptide (TPR) repeat protein
LDKITLSNRINQENQEAIIEEFVTNGARKYNYNYQMAEWQNCLDEGLKKIRLHICGNKINAHFKAKKYEVGMKYLDKAVKYNPERWQSYRAFINVFCQNL